ncbi:MAG: hypothetical protein AAF569_07100 [Pseudomonadota bacterium]
MALDIVGQLPRASILYENDDGLKVVRKPGLLVACPKEGFQRVRGVGETVDDAMTSFRDNLKSLIDWGEELFFRMHKEAEPKPVEVNPRGKLVLAR